MGFLESTKAGEIGPGAVFDEEIDAKASFERRVLWILYISRESHFTLLISLMKSFISSISVSSHLISSNSSPEKSTYM